MGITKFVGSLALVAMAVPLSGCASRAPVEEAMGTASSAETAPKPNRFCVGIIASGEAEKLCHPATKTPSEVWSLGAEAADGHREPAFIWAGYPEGMSALEVGSNKKTAQAWLADADRALAFARNKNAEVYQESLEATQILAAAIGNAQGDALERSLPDPIRDFRTKITATAERQKGPIQTQLANDKVTVGQITAIIDASKARVDGLAPRLAEFLTRFRDFRATEQGRFNALAALSAQASAATIATLPATEIELARTARVESPVLDGLVVDANRLQAEYRAIGDRLDRSLDPHRDFIATRTAVVPDMTSSALRALQGVVSYCEARRARIDTIVARLVDGAKVRRQLLVLRAADEATRETRAQTALLTSSRTFLDEATGRVEALWKLPPTSTQLRLPYLGDRYDQFSTFLDLESFCDASATWREAGCAALRRHFSTARTYQTRTLPMLIRNGLSQMRTRGVDSALLDTAQAHLTANDVRSASLAYDLAVTASEGVQP